MMLPLGVLSVLQLILVPGLLLIRLFPGKRSFIQQLTYVFMLSLLANYAAVLLLVAIGLYLRSVVLALFAIEAVAVLWVYRDTPLGITGGWEKKVRDAVAQTLTDLSQWIKKDFWSAALYVVFGILAVLGILWVLWVWVSNFNTVFQNWDAWGSWDRWAENWAQNRFPGDTWEYPQLIPVSYSLAYKFIGTTAVKFFGKSIMPLFALFITLMLFDLGLKKRSWGYMAGAGLALYSINLFLGEYIPDGYVDIPVACISLMAIVTLLHARDVRDPRELKATLLLGSLASATAAVTKQTGLYVMAFYPVFAYLWVLRGRKDFSLRASILLLAKHFGLALLLVAPWYIFMEYRILYGGNTSNIQYVITDIYKGQTLPERFVAAVASLKWYVWVFILAFISLLVVDASIQQLLILMVFPFSILWAFFLSYEPRNLAVSFPLLSMSVGLGLEAWVARLRAMLGKPRPLRVPVYAGLLAAAVLLGVGAFALNDEVITARQLSEQRLIFEPTLNQKLYRYFSSHNGPERVITSYPVGWLPDLEDTWILERFQDYDVYQATLNQHPEATLILLPLLRAEPRIMAEVQANIDSGLYALQFSEADYILVRIPPR